MDLCEFNVGQSGFTIVRAYLENEKDERKESKKEKRKGKNITARMVVYTYSSQLLRKLRQEAHLNFSSLEHPRLSETPLLHKRTSAHSSPHKCTFYRILSLHTVGLWNQLLTHSFLVL